MKYKMSYNDLSSIIESVFRTIYTGDTLSITPITRATMYQKIIKILYSKESSDIDESILKGVIIKKLLVSEDSDMVTFITMPNIDKCIIKSLHINKVEHIIVCISSDVLDYDEQDLADTINIIAREFISRYIRPIDDTDTSPDSSIVFAGITAIILRCFWTFSNAMAKYTSAPFTNTDIKIEGISDEYIKYVLDALIEYDFSIEKVCDQYGLWKEGILQ